MRYKVVKEAVELPPDLKPQQTRCDVLSTNTLAPSASPPIDFSVFLLCLRMPVSVSEARNLGVLSDGRGRLLWRPFIRT